jgi:leucyl aminopeptidase
MTLRLDLTDSIPTADLLVVATNRGPDGPTLRGAGLAEEQVDGLRRDAVAVAATGKADETVRLPGSQYGLPPVLLTGLGEATDQLDPEVLRRAVGAALRAAAAEHVAVSVPHGDDAALVEAAALGAALGAYRYPGRPQADPPVAAPDHVSVVVADTAGLDAAIARARVLGECTALTRLLVDTPPGDLPPEALATQAVAAVEGLGVGVEVLDVEALDRGGFGGILAVGQGSANPPRLVRLTWAPEGATSHLGLVGKGITFDSGGLSLKPPTGMITMKTDMAGAAAVLGTVCAVARLGLAVQITAYLAIAENMPSGSAQRPGDVITAYGGRTVEVLNTDAEGRLVMMDALTRCAEDDPDAVVDIATLTGAQIVALGSRIAGAMGNDDGFRGQVVAAAGAAGELVWPMPIGEELRPSLDSPVADLANIGERNGGMMTAAAFLREFVPSALPWAHLDIAGPSWVDGSPWGYNGKGATGFGVRTLVQLAESMAGTADEV